MKTIKIILISLIIIYNLTSCSNDNNPIETTELIGNWSGTYTGDNDNGIWEIEILENGNVNGTTTSNITNEIFNVIGLLNTEGELTTNFTTNTNINFNTHIIHNYANSDFYTNHVIAKDIDGDNDLDLFIFGGSGNIAWLINEGNGNFTNQNNIANLENTNLKCVGFQAGDFDNDGNIDLVAKLYDYNTPSNSKIVWYRNTDGQGAFSSENFISSTVGTEGLFVADINNDGSLDVINGFHDYSTMTNKIVWYSNNGQGTFNSEQIISSNIDTVSSLYVTDIDNDGYNDIVSTSEGDNKVMWYKNINGQGSFSQQLIINQNSPRALEATDIDNDGDIDLLFINDTKLIWLENTDSLGSFTAHTILSFDTTYSSDIHAIDIDGDNDKDVIAIYRAGNNKIVAWFENTDSQGNFGAPQILLNSGSKTSSLYAGDLDGDGDIDVLSADHENEENTLAWYENLGNGYFNGELSESIASGTWSHNNGNGTWSGTKQ